MTKKMYIKVESMTDSDKLIAINPTVEALKKAIYQICEMSQDDTTAIFTTIDDLITIDDEDDDESESETIEDNDDGFVSHSLGIKEENELKVGKIIKFNNRSYDKNDYRKGIVISWSVLDGFAYVIDITNVNQKTFFCELIQINLCNIICDEISYLGRNPNNNYTARHLIYVLRSYCYKSAFINSTGYNIKNGKFSNYTIVEIMKHFDFETKRGGIWSNALVSFYWGEKMKRIGGE